MVSMFDLSGEGDGPKIDSPVAVTVGSELFDQVQWRLVVLSGDRGWPEEG
jgi:hypothetical protein